jgi:condensin complex subunit 3
LRDSACNTALAKFETAIVKKFEKQLEQFSEEDFRKLEELNELFEFLDSIIPLDDDEPFDPEPRKRGRKR